MKSVFEGDKITVVEGNTSGYRYSSKSYNREWRADVFVAWGPVFEQEGAWGEGGTGPAN